MTEERFREILAEEGYTEAQATGLLANKPEDLSLEDVSEDIIRQVAQTYAPAYQLPSIQAAAQRLHG